MTLMNVTAEDASCASIVEAQNGIAWSVETHSAFPALEAEWSELQQTGLATPYQTYEWMRCWSEALTAPLGITPLLVTLRDPQKRLLALFPLGIRFRRGLRVASFLGGRHANMSMGLFDRGLAVRLRGEDITRALRQVGAQHRIDLFWFEDQPVTWDGFSNPLVHLPHQPSPSSAWKTALMLDDEAMIRSLMSSESRKKLRHKEKKLGAFGTISFSEILHPREVDQALTAFFEQKAQRLSVMGFANPFAEVCVQSFIRSAALSGLAEGKPALSLFAMKAGERFLSVFGGLISGGRFTGMFTSFDADPDVARYSPGDLLLLNLVRMMCRKGLHTFDLGTGEAAYKNDYCRTEEPLFDSLLPMTWKGSVAAMGVSTLTSAKRKIKRNERALALLKRLRGFVRGRG